MPDPEKKFYRNLKRTIKKAGNRKRRRSWKDDHPEEAHWDEYDFGRESSEWLNGLDKDKTRQRDDEIEEHTEEDRY
jgi:hypothetical protein